MPYSITRDDAAADLKVLRAAIEKFRYPDEDEYAQQQALEALADSIEEQAKPLPLSEWETELLNLRYRKETAVAVLEAMDVDQYLIDAVSNASPQSDATTALPTSPSPEVGVATSPPVASSLDGPFTEGFDAACNEILKDLIHLRGEAITAPEQNVLDKAIAATKRQRDAR